jgi:hypothetical protein
MGWLEKGPKENAASCVLYLTFLNFLNFVFLCVHVLSLSLSLSHTHTHTHTADQSLHLLHLFVILQHLSFWNA